MNDDAPPSVDELISRHFDEALPLAEHQRLTAALDADVAARLYFVDTARLHAGLEALAPALPRVKKRYVGGWVLAGAAAALMLSGVALFLHQPLRDQIRITLQDMDGMPNGKPEKPKPPGLVRRVVKSPASLLSAAEPIDVQKLLERYYVNVSPHGLTVPQALVRLEEAIKFENVFKRPDVDTIKFLAQQSMVPNSPDPIVFTPEQAPFTVAGYLEICRLYRRVIEQPFGVTAYVEHFQRIPHAVAPLPQTREFRVPAEFLTLGGTKPPYPEGNAAAAVLARSFGIQLDDYESATFSSNPPTLTVAALSGKLDQLKQRLEVHAKSNNPKQVFVTTRYLRLPLSLLPSGFDVESGRVMPDSEYLQFLTALKADKRVITVEVPSIIVRAGQLGKVEIRQEIGSSKPTKDSVGFTQDILPSFTGELIRFDGLIEFGILEGLSMPGGLNALGFLTNGSPVPQYFKTEYETWLPDRSTGLFVADSPQPEGFVTLVCLTATLIDPIGQTFNPGALETKPANELFLGKPIEGKSGFISSPWAPDKGPVDVSGIPSGANVKCPYTGKTFQVP